MPLFTVAILSTNDFFGTHILCSTDTHITSSNVGLIFMILENLCFVFLIFRFYFVSFSIKEDVCKDEIEIQFINYFGICVVLCLYQKNSIE